MVLLSEQPDGACSAFLAGSVNTHAAFLRRVLSRLAHARLIEAREGRDGGYRLTQPPEEITLDAIYRATVDEQALRPNPAVPNPLCPTSIVMESVFADIADRAEEALLAYLGERTVADVARAIGART